jgi:molybdate transport system regulatory protein
MPKSIKNTLKESYLYEVSGSLWIECKQERFFGPGRVELLNAIAETGSISKGAKQMGMSYKKAWEMVNSLNAQTARPVVIPKTGGDKGGGSTLTGEALQLINYHRLLRERFTRFLERETRRLRT